MNRPGPPTYIPKPLQSIVATHAKPKMSRRMYRNTGLPAGCTYSVGKTVEVSIAVVYQTNACKPVYLPPVDIPVRTLADIARDQRAVKNAADYAIKQAKRAAKIARKEAAEAKAAAKAAKPIRLRKDGKPYGSPKD